MFRTLTQVGLLTFLPLFLAYELGYNPFIVGRVHGGAADRRLRRQPHRRPPVRQMGPRRLVW